MRSKNIIPLVNENSSVVVYSFDRKKRKAESMKKIFIIMALTAFAVPVFATCSITGDTCSASLMTTPSLEDKFLPNNIKNIQKTDAFTPQYITPYHSILLNTEEPNMSPEEENPSYNANCQFGVCLPGASGSESTLFH